MVRSSLLQLLLDNDRLLDAAPLRLPGVQLHVGAIMGPIRKLFRHWREIEPYDYRLPLLEQGAIALLGWCVMNSAWDLCACVLIGFHCWIRPEE